MDFQGKDVNETNQFLSELVESLNSALLIVDSEARIQYYNSYCAVLFNPGTGPMQDKRCGNGLGCIYTAISGMLCGDTPYCAECVIRKSILKTFAEKVPVTRQMIKREFLTEGKLIMRTLLFSTRRVVLGGRKMVLIIVDDMSELVEQKEKLEELNRELNFANRLMHQQLEIARSIQTEMMPKQFPESPFFRIAAVCKPYEELAGDFYDFHQFSPEKISFFISDVSGHGVSSALITMMQKPLISSFFKFNLPPDDIMTRINNTLYHFMGNDGFFLTAICGSIDFEKMQLEYTIAAHPEMLLVRADGTSRLIPEAKKDLLVGMFPKVSFQVFREPLFHGDRLVIYTDGVTETSSVSHELFGAERLADVVRKNLKSPPETVIGAIIKETMAFGSHQAIDDDITIMVIEIV